MRVEARIMSGGVQRECAALGLSRLRSGFERGEQRQWGDATEPRPSTKNEVGANRRAFGARGRVARSDSAPMRGIKGIGHSRAGGYNVWVYGVRQEPPKFANRNARANLLLGFRSGWWGAVARRKRIAGDKPGRREGDSPGAGSQGSDGADAHPSRQPAQQTRATGMRRRKARRERKLCVFLRFGAAAISSRLLFEQVALDSCRAIQ